MEEERRRKDYNRKCETNAPRASPHGIKHHYALLGLLAAATGGAFKFTALRRTFAGSGNA